MTQDTDALPERTTLTQEIASTTGLRHDLAVELRAGIRRMQIMQKMRAVISRAEEAAGGAALSEEQVHDLLASEREVRLAMAAILYAHGRTGEADRDVETADVIAELLTLPRAREGQMRAAVSEMLRRGHGADRGAFIGRAITDLTYRYRSFPAAYAVRVAGDMFDYVA